MFFTLDQTNKLVDVDIKWYVVCTYLYQIYHPTKLNQIGISSGFTNQNLWPNNYKSQDLDKRSQKKLTSIPCGY